MPGNVTPRTTRVDFIKAGGLPEPPVLNET